MQLKRRINRPESKTKNLHKLWRSRASNMSGSGEDVAIAADEGLIPAFN
jgi:hypothetical protein